MEMAKTYQVHQHHVRSLRAASMRAVARARSTAQLHLQPVRAQSLRACTVEPIVRVMRVCGVPAVVQPLVVGGHGAELPGVDTYLERTASPRASAAPASTRPPPLPPSSLSSSSHSCPACRMSRRMKDPWARSLHMTLAPGPAATPRTDTLPHSPPPPPSLERRRRPPRSQTHTSVPPRPWDAARHITHLIRLRIAVRSLACAATAAERVDSVLGFWGSGRAGRQRWRRRWTRTVWYAAR